MKNQTILIVDDAEINRSMLADMLGDEYNIIEATNGLEAVSVLKRDIEKISLVLLDIIMPKMDGFEVLSIMNATGMISNVPVIIISAEKVPAMIDHAYDLGATDYINRPFEPKTVLRRVHNTIMLYTKQRNLENMVLEQIMQRERSTIIMVELLSHIVEFRNGESGLHVLNIRIITDMILRRLTEVTDKYDLTPEKIGLITNASILHDIGKISIPETILNKPGKLTKEEFEVIKTHSAIGAQMLESTSYFKSEELVNTARDVCRWHHERYDGRGYPDGLKGEEIPICAQVVALADVYDALTHERVYKPAYPHEKAVEMILNGECGAFNPLLLQCLTDIGADLKQKLQSGKEDTVESAEERLTHHSFVNAGEPSRRTVTLFEQERTKYQYLATMSKEVQFEYAKGSDAIMITDCGANIGIPEVIVDPRESNELKELLSPVCLNEIIGKIKLATKENPIVEQLCLLTVNGEKEWHKVVARPIWQENDSSEISGVIGKMVNVNDEQNAMSKLLEDANRDALTGLYNRIFVRRVINNVIDKLEEGTRYALLLFDIDNFKKANDSYGHLFGDEILLHIAQSINKIIADKSIIASRVGGDEFLLFMKLDDGAQKLLDDFVQIFNDHYKGYEIRISVGVAIAPFNGTLYRQLFVKADKALYTAKHNGGNRLCYYDDSMSGMLSSLLHDDE